jgi:hypothetical protein
MIDRTWKKKKFTDQYIVNYINFAFYREINDDDDDGEEVNKGKKVRRPWSERSWKGVNIHSYEPLFTEKPVKISVKHETLALLSLLERLHLGFQSQPIKPIAETIKNNNNNHSNIY